MVVMMIRDNTSSEDRIDLGIDLDQLVLAEEDRARFTITKSSGEFRWFRSPNVICLEKARRFRRGQR
jgi:hypothetical protein